MKIAVPYENGQVFQHFGHSAQFKIYNAENGQVLSSEVISTNGQGHGALVGFLVQHGADVVLCGGIGTGAQVALMQAGIQMFGGVSGAGIFSTQYHGAGNVEGVRAALENGVDSIEHGAKLDEHLIRLFRDRGACLCTTLSPALPYALFDRSVTHATEVEQFNGNVVFEGIIACAKAALANDIPVVLGNDVGCPWITQYDFWRELCYFHKYCGVSNKFALYTATKRNAEIAHIDNITGTVEPGKCADLIVTDANPIDDLKTLRNVKMVMARGHLIREPKVKKYENVERELDKFL